MSTIAIIAIVVGAALLLAVIAATIFARPRIQERRRVKARDLRDRAAVREARAQKEHAAASEQQARARRQAAEAQERAQLADRELATAGKEHRRAGRLDPDR
jgi:biopolymer transport protein ExbB/TolQ